MSSWNWPRILALTVAGYFFLVALNTLGLAFVSLGEPTYRGMITATDNPFIGLFIGLLVTAILQSSSITTSIVVSLMASGAFGAAHDPETISRAIPFILGANIGTAATSSFVSFGHIGNIQEFKRALEAATLHDLFNIFTVMIVLPLELAFGLLSRSASFLAHYLFVGGYKGVEGVFKYINAIVEPPARWIAEGSVSLFGDLTVGSVVAGLAGIVLLFLTLRWFVAIIARPMRGRIQRRTLNSLFQNPYKAFGIGFSLTALLQSSSLTTSLAVPVVASGRLSLRKVFPFIMGANVGTTLTALMVALLSSISPNPQAGLAIAFAHLLFNMMGALIFLPFKGVRELPIKVAQALGRATVKNRAIGIGYFLVIFFLVPFFLITLNQALKPAEPPKAQDKPMVIDSSAGGQQDPQPEAILP